MPPRRGGGSSGSGPSSARAASLLAKARAAAAKTPAATSAAHSAASKAEGSSSSPSKSSGISTLPGFSATSGSVPSTSAPNTFVEPAKAPSPAVPLQTLIKQLTSANLPVRDAIIIAGKLMKGGFAIPEKLALLSPAALEQIGVDGEDIRRKVAAAFAGKRTAVMLKAAAAGNTTKESPKRRRKDDDEVLSREWGNVAGLPSSSRMDRYETPVSFVFNEVLQESEIRGRYAYVNRAPVMTAWATIVLERLGFDRAEALSVAHCYVSFTSTARGVSLGIIPSSTQTRMAASVSPAQPHFELMGVKIPVMQVEDGKWRGILEGDRIGPERAFNYIKKSMAQTLPLVIGALTLLAESYMEPLPQDTSFEPASGAIKREAELQAEATDAIKLESDERAEAKPDLNAETSAFEDTSLYGSDALHAEAFRLYCQLRPETGGEWGKRARFDLDKVLALRRGREADWEEYQRKHTAESIAETQSVVQDEREQADEERQLEEEIRRMEDIEREAAGAANGGTPSKRVETEIKKEEES